MISGRLVAIREQTYKEQKTTLENGHPEGEKVKTNFQCVIPPWSKEKISGSDFKISGLLFKKQATNFLPSENPFETYPKSADKYGLASLLRQ